MLRAACYVLRAACCVLRLDDGALVRVVNRGLRHAAPDDMARLLRGEPVDPARVYFRTAPQFEASGLVIK